jgi:hypothetical protein
MHYILVMRKTHVYVLHRSKEFDPAIANDLIVELNC